MTTEQTIPYVENPEALPDKAGTPVAVGDFVMTDKGDIWRVRSLTAAQEHEPGDLYKKTGNLSLEYSRYEVEKPTRADGLGRFIDGMTFEPVTQWAIGLQDATRVDDPELARKFEQAAIDQAHAVLDRVEANIAAKRRELKRREEALR